VSLFQTRRAHTDAEPMPAEETTSKHINDIFSKLESVTEQLQERLRPHHHPAGTCRHFLPTELLLPRLASFSSSPRRDGTSASKPTFSAPKTHPPEADLSIVVGAGPWDGLVVHELFAQNFIAACSPAFFAGQPHRYLR